MNNEINKITNAKNIQDDISKLLLNTIIVINLAFISIPSVMIAINPNIVSPLLFVLLLLICFIVIVIAISSFINIRFIGYLWEQINRTKLKLKNKFPKYRTYKHKIKKHKAKYKKQSTSIITNLKTKERYLILFTFINGFILLFMFFHKYAIILIVDKCIKN